MKPVLEIDLKGPDGNIFVVVSKAIQLMKRTYSEKDIDSLKSQVLSSQSYEEALLAINEYVSIEPI